MSKLSTQIIIPSDAQLFAVAQQANAQHLHLLTDGSRTVLSPFVLPGWYKLAVKIKESRAA